MFRFLPLLFCLMTFTACDNAVTSESSVLPLNIQKDTVVVADTFFIKEEAVKTFNQNVFHPPVPSSFTFAGEKMPLERVDVKEMFQQEIIRNTFYHSSTINFIKRAPRAFEVIDPILKEYGIPEDFKYLAVAESSLVNAVSPAGAKGYWQFMNGAGKEYGLEINKDIDERYNLEKSTVAACKYLKKMKGRLGNWTFAAAGYNMGPTGLNNNITQQKEKTYYDLNLNQETGRYVYRICAIKHLMQNPKEYGFNIGDEFLQKPHQNLKTVKVNYTINSLADFANKHGITYRELKYYNPWLLDGKLPNASKKNYELLIPKK